jgi:hypothetical protein
MPGGRGEHPHGHPHPPAAGEGARGRPDHSGDGKGRSAKRGLRHHRVKDSYDQWGRAPLPQHSAGVLDGRSVLDTRRADRFAGPAAEAAIEVRGERGVVG